MLIIDFIIIFIFSFVLFHYYANFICLFRDSHFITPRDTYS